ncbi:GNAT family N-acetyltransferase [Cupriavidus basilensis]|jgi:ribosomal protein S18 acetylase RimI-like enzyme|uniref:GNAT family N-acetyltransferase n=1 Tax=Cupriavidus TaxID=106589 RepID=UPI000451AB64|nr:MULTISPECIES: GNAT family N-acetyltransferase [Cupriavidus]KDP86778.1 GNAT family acetyltransferase [Cupriavidus sp. SK-3]MDF3882883.1 GNAT family N-acetyltransferase [Cupriavidus basilensis]
MEVRPLGVDDVELVCRHREEMFREAGRDNDILQTMTRQFRPWLEPRLRDGSYFGFVLEDQGQPVAGIGLMAIDWPPHPSHPTQDKRGYVLNVYVDKTYRKQGLGRRLMQLAEDEFARREVQFAILHATEMGRSLYVALGWHATSEMAKAVRA